MHDKLYRIRIFLIQPFLWLRIFCMFAALLGSQLFVLSSLAAVEGHIHTPSGGQHVRALPSAQRGMEAQVSRSTTNLKTVVPAGTDHGNKGRQAPTTQSGGAQGPDLAISVQADATAYQPGATVNYALTINNSPGAGTVLAKEPVVVTDLIPLGLSNITLATSSLQSWKFTITNTTSPSLIVATYTGALPIISATTLPTIHIAGTVTLQAGPSLINVSSVNATGDQISNNNMALVEVTILKARTTPFPTVVVTQTPTLLLTATPIPTPVSTITATATSVPTATATAVVTATPTPIATVTVVSTLTPVPTATLVPTATATAITALTPTVTAAFRPALVTNQTTPGGEYFTVGQQVQYVILVRNLPVAGAELLPITLTDFVRPGLTHVIPSGSNWSFSVNVTTSPATIFARYTGAYPVMPGQVLPAITLTGVLMAGAVPELTNTAVVTSSDNPGASNVDTTSDTIFVVPVQPTPVAGSPVPTATVPTVGSPLPLTPPNLAVASIHLNGDRYRVGDQINTVLIVHDLAQAGPIVFPNPVSVTYILPIGVTNVVAQGQGWTFVLSSTTSPAVISAFYSGHFPIGTGDALPAITLNATLTVEAIPSFTGTAIVDTPGNVSTSNMFTDTFFVSKQLVTCPGKACNSGSGGTGHSATPTPGRNGGTSGPGTSGGNTGSGTSGNNGPAQSGSGGSPHGNLPGLPGTGSDPNL